jgi:hypothetical protein
MALDGAGGIQPQLLAPAVQDQLVRPAVSQYLDQRDDLGEPPAQQVLELLLACTRST